MEFDWQTARLGDLGRVVTGKTPPTTDVGNFGADYPFITIPDLGSSRYITSTDRKLSKKGAEVVRSSLLPAGAVLMSCIATIGKRGITTQTSFTNQQINAVICNDLVRPEYLYYVFGQLVGQLEAAGGGGSVYTNVSKSRFSNLVIQLPPLGTQESIAEILGKLDDRIDLLRQTNATLESIAQALFKSWFIDFDPVRAKAEGREPEGMDAATAALFPAEFEESALGLIPKGWRIGTVRDVCSIFDSKRVPLSGRERAKRQGQYPYYGAAALMDHVDDFLFDGVYLLLGEDGSVTNMDGTPITQYVWGKFWVNNHAHVLQGAHGVSTEHLMVALRGMDFTPYVTGAVQAKLNQANLFRIPFLLADPKVSAAFGLELEHLYGKLRANSEQAMTLATLRDTLLPRLISGRLRLPEAETAIAAVA